MLGRMVLTELMADDAAAVLGLLSDWNVVRYMLIPLCRSSQDARRFVETANEQQGSLRWITRAIRERADGELVGLCGLGVVAEREEAEAWYLVDPRHWGKGVAGAALGQLLNIAFDELSVHRVWATCLPENPASARVLEKSGFRREGLLRKNLKVHGEWLDSWLYAMLREERSR
jgi:[ribosomal protein S5]-alanine N-acetyltransferase